MPILVDFSQVAISGIFAFQKDLETGSDEKIVNLIRHVVLTSLVSNKRKFGPTYGNMIICADGRNYWRKKVFPLYKGKRAQGREESKINWGLVFDTISSLRDDLKEHFPYKVVVTEGAEADDVIGVLTEYFQENELIEQGLETEPQKILILSSDQDNLQLQKYRGVSQWSPMQKKAVKPALSAQKSLIDKICMGDTGDGIPNIMSADNCLMEGIRQSPFKKARLEEFYKLGIDACKNDTERARFQRNEMLVSYEKIPQEIRERIIHTYLTHEPTVSKKKIMDYLISHRCKNLLDDIESF